ncbi:MAG: histidine phosphatase family protein [Prevotellaceae bacterium]|nr:histidine phosphatase family protein [Prevotellaceae bacterium]
MTTLYLVRHGETVDNINRIMQGQTQGQLNETGLKQAETVASEMADKHFDAIVASDLKRAVDTAAIIAKPHQLEVVTTPLLRERDWGSFTGLYIPDLKFIKQSEWPNDIEPLDHLQDRAKNFISYIRSTYNGKCVLAVGHGIINKAIQSVYYNRPMKDIMPMANVEVRILEL